MSDTPCIDCPLRRLPLFLPHNREELALVQFLKRREQVLQPGKTLIHEGQTDTRLYTVLEGWAYRFKTLSDGPRQILNFLLAGDFVGVQQKMGDAAAHGVVTLTTARFCVFDRDAIWQLHRDQPSMGFNITWLTAHEESLVDDNLLSVGRRSAEERVASALILLYKRAAALGRHGEALMATPPGQEAGAGPDPAATAAEAMPSADTPPEGVLFPVTQQHLADALGLSLAYTNKTLRKLERRGLFQFRDGRLVLRDPKALLRLADLYGDGKPPTRPLI